MANTLLLAQIPIIAILLWLFTSWTTSTFPTLSNKKIALVIAHPDDEAMFFAPTLLALTRPELRNEVVIICFSTGDADGLGETRRRELQKSALLLGLRDEERVVVIDDPAKFADGMNNHWDAREISKVLGSYFAPDMSKAKAKARGRNGANAGSDAPPAALLDAVITFDETGVSDHPNHKALYHGTRAFMRELMKGHGGWESPVAMYTLTSVNMVRKYSSLFDVVASVATMVLQPKHKGASPDPLLFVSGPKDLRTAQRAMTTAHESQMRWFRWGWIGISRYMGINDLRKVKSP